VNMTYAILALIAAISAIGFIHWAVIRKLEQIKQLEGD